MKTKTYTLTLDESELYLLDSLVQDGEDYYTEDNGREILGELSNDVYERLQEKFSEILGSIE